MRCRFQVTDFDNGTGPWSVDRSAGARAAAGQRPTELVGRLSPKIGSAARLNISMESAKFVLRRQALEIRAARI